MRVLYVIPYFIPWGGPAQVVAQVARRIADLGHQATIFTTDTGPGNQRAVIPDAIGKVEIVTFPNLSAVWARQKRAFFPPRYFVEFRRRLVDFDLVHIIEYRHLLGVWAVRQASKSAVPTLLSPHGSLPNAMQRVMLKDLFDRVFGRRTLARIDAFHALTDQERAFMLDRGLAPEKISMIPNGVELPDLPGPAERDKAREKWGLGPDDITALFMARLHKEKGLEILLHALAGCENRNIKLIAAGADDGVLESARAFVRERNLAGRVVFPGFLQGDEKRAAFAAADLFVSLSNFETMPVSVLEGMSFAKPLLVSQAVASVVHGLDHEKVGLTVPSGDAVAASRALDRLSRDAQDRLAWGRQARALVEDRYHWDRIVDAYLGMYDRLVNP